MTDLLLTHSWALWVTLGGLLLVTEMVGAQGYLLWSGIAAIVTGLITGLVPWGWEWQSICFALLTLVAAWSWWRWLSRRRETVADWTPNQRGHDLIGRTFTLDAPLHDGRGNIRIGDSSWPVMAEADLPAGSRVTVIALEGITLRVRADS